MKTYQLLVITLLLTNTAAQAQDFRAVPPAEQPNAAELAYFGGRHPNVPASNVSDTASVRLVVDFLNDLKNGQLEAAHGRLSEGFRAYGPGFADSQPTDDLLQQWDRYGRLFAHQQFAIDTATLTRVPDGDHQVTWVFVKGIWSGQDSRRRGFLIRVPFYTLARLANGLIERTYTSYGRDQLFYDLGLPLYPTGPTLRQPEITQKR